MPASEDARLVIEANGSISVEGSSLVERLQASAGRWRWLEVNDQLAMLTRSSDVAKRARLLMGGEIIAPGTMLEVLGLLSLNGWQGELGVHARDRVRQLRIGKRALHAASSNVPTERLGVVLCDLGFLSQAQLEHCLAGGDRDQRIGELAIAHGYVTNEQLFHALQVQMQRIVQNAVIEHEGHYALLDRNENDDDVLSPAFSQHMPLQELLLESVRRLDEMAAFRQRVPSSDVCPIASAKARRTHSTLAGSLRDAFALADGKHNILDMARVLHVDEYEATRLVCQLAQIGAVEIAGTRDANTAEIERAQILIVRFNRVLKRIFDNVRRSGDDGQLLRALQHWIADTQLSRYIGDALGPSGELEAERVLSQLAAAEGSSAVKTLHGALQELAAFAMLSAGDLLPRAAERTLSQYVRRSLARLRRNDD